MLRCALSLVIIAAATLGFASAGDDAATLPKVTVMTATCVDRQFLHENLYAMFNHQDYEGETELLIFDGECRKKEKDRTNQEVEGAPGTYELSIGHQSDKLLGYALEDPRVRYHFDATIEAAGLNARRQWLLDHATGDIIAVFDDDDFYSPKYLSTMVARLEAARTDDGEPVEMIKLNGWNYYGFPTHKDREIKVVHADYTGTMFSRMHLGTMVIRRSVLGAAGKNVTFPTRKDHWKDLGFYETAEQGNVTMAFFVEPEATCLYLKIVIGGVRRFAGMPDRAHAAGATFGDNLDPAETLAACNAESNEPPSGGIKWWTDNVVWLYNQATPPHLWKPVHERPPQPTRTIYSACPAALAEKHTVDAAAQAHLAAVKAKKQIMLENLRRSHRRS